jgi:hypothetical protein
VLFSTDGRGPSTLLPSQHVLTNLGTWSIGLVALSLTVFGMRAGLTTPVRRLISAVWATATFWPRAAHPFGAPAHGPRAVADMVRRVTRLTRQDRSVLLAGHSHGALITTTTVLYLPVEVTGRCALLTSASPVTRLIRPYFGAFLDHETLVDVAERMTDGDGTRWRNLFRITDPIGGPVFGASPAQRPVVAGRPRTVDRLSPDPELANLRAGTDATPRGHGDYLHDPAFLSAHAALVEHLRRARP